MKKDDKELSLIADFLTGLSGGKVQAKAKDGIIWVTPIEGEDEDKTK
jgi:hypothetical protein